MHKLLVGAIGGAALLQSGCAIIRDVERAKADLAVAKKEVETDVSEAMKIWHQDLSPEFQKLKTRVVKADEDITANIARMEKLWTSTIEPQIGATRAFFQTLSGEIEADVRKTEELWDKDVEPRLKTLEAAIEKIEQDIENVAKRVEGDVKSVLGRWHDEFETHLNQLERVAGTAAADFRQFENSYDKMKAGLRTIPARIADDVKHNSVVQKVEQLVEHVHKLGQNHAQGITQEAISSARKDITAGVREMMKIL